MDQAVAIDGTVQLGGVAYVQVLTSTFQPPASGHPCYWCCAWSNIRLCDQLCQYCNEQHVFVRKDTKRYVR